jgi:hypothetical protein
VNGNNVLERVGSASKNTMAIVAVLSGLAGMLTGAFAIAFYLRDELAIWEKIKLAHQTELPDAMMTVVYDHQQLNEAEIAAIEAQLQLPNFSDFALKTELWNNQKLDETLAALGYLKVGQRILIKDASEPAIALTRHASDYANTYDESRTNLTGKWSRIWFIEKEK